MALTDKDYKVAEKDCEAFEQYISGRISYHQLRTRINKNHGETVPSAKIDEWLNQGWIEDFSNNKRR